jgi:putative proteasome-type protease
MTFCLGMRVKDGLVGIADTMVTSGNEVITAGKVSIYNMEHGSMFLMTSGLRSVRDKTLTYFDDHISNLEKPFNRLFKAVNAVSEQIRIVAKEDKASLVDSGFNFDMNCLIGGQMHDDPEHLLYLVYPQGNWVEIGKGTPYQIIGAPGYGKPILDRTFDFDDSLSFALKVGCLSFDSTRISAADVDFPMDVVLYRKNSFKMLKHRFEREDLGIVSDLWDTKLRETIKSLPTERIDRALAKLIDEE